MFTWLGLSHSFLAHLCNGTWLTCKFNCAFGCDFARAIVASVAWHIWTARCFKIFRQIPPNFNQLPSKAWARIKAFFSAHGLINRNAIYHLHSTRLILLVYSDASWDPLTGKAGFGFVISTNYNVIFLAGAAGGICDSSLGAKLRAILFALEHYHSNGWSPSTFFSNCRCAIHLINDFNRVTAWRHFDTVQAIKNFSSLSPDLAWEHIDRDHNTLADRLAHFGSSNPTLSLFAQGRDWPYWIDDLCSSLNFSF